MIKVFKIIDWKIEENEYTKLLEKLDQKEKERIKRFKFFIDSKRSLSGLLIAKKEIIKEFLINEEDLKFERTKYNKPIFINEKIKNFDFNISHSGDYVVYGQIKDNIIGVDVERITKRNSLYDFLKYLQDCFTDYEWFQITETSNWQNCDDYEEEKQKGILNRFYINWTLKESFIKAIGKGLNYELKKLEFRINGDDTKLYIDNEEEKAWNFYYYFIDDEHVCSIATKNYDFSKLKIETIKDEYFY
jgi:4'-phosphopantetheinyl transferase